MILHELQFHRRCALQKLVLLIVLYIWAKTSSKGSLECTVTLFSLSTLPNTLVMGIPPLKGMYGAFLGSLMVQIVVLQCIIWYTLLLFLFEYRGARLLISEQFPDNAASIVSFKVDSDIASLDGREPLHATQQPRLRLEKMASFIWLFASQQARESSFNHNDFFSLVSNDEESGGHGGAKLNGLLSPMVGKKKVHGSDGASKDLHMFVWNSSASPVSENTTAGVRDVCNEFSFRNQERDGGRGEKQGSDTMAEHNVKDGVKDVKAVAMPAASVMTRLILTMVWRKLIRNPNTYSSLIGLIWSLVSFRWGTEMPAIIARSISILSDAGLGMAMFSLGLFMALQPKMIAYGNSVAAFSMAVRFIVGPVVMVVASYVIGLRGVLLHVAIVQAALPQGIVPFVFAEYNVHPKILSTGVIFGMLIALPITLVYYILLGL